MLEEKLLNQIPLKAMIYAAIALALALFLYGLYAHGYKSGYQTSELKYQAIITEREAAAHEVLRASYEALRTREREHATELNAIANGYLAKIKEVNHAKTVAISNAYTHGLYLRGTCGGSPDSVSDAISAPSGNYGTSRVRLSNADADFFIGFAAQCDAVATQLSSCQKIVTEDRR
jgi:hypothetical protein